MDKNKKKIFWITRTAIFIALLVVIQAATAPFKVTLLTGSLVNMILVVSVMTCGFSSGLIVSVISPFLAMLFGIGPQLWPIVLLIALGNTVLVLLWYLICKKALKEKLVGYIAALAAAAVGKFLFLYVSIVQLALPLILKLPEKQAAALSATFSVPQLITALIGGVLAILVLPVIRKATSSRAH
jgi:uncharacterized membrane protein